MPVCILSVLLIISIHVPAWGTTFQLPTTESGIVFQSTFPRGERRSFFGDSATLHIFQSTFPRGERPDGNEIACFRAGISIHVPAWGTTSCVAHMERVTKISIHVPAWGTTEILKTYVQG